MFSSAQTTSAAFITLIKLKLSFLFISIDEICDLFSDVIGMRKKH